MSFLGKIVYLALFPGAMFSLLGGTIALALNEALSLVGLAHSSGGTLVQLRGLFSADDRFPVDTGPSGRVVLPVFAVFALSWVSASATGFLEDGIPLILGLLIAAELSMVAYSPPSSQDESERFFLRAFLRIAAWLLPLTAGMITTALRTGEIGTRALAEWSAGNGLLLFSGEGGWPSVVATALAFAGSVIALDLFQDSEAVFGVDGEGGGEIRSVPMVMKRYVAPLLLVTVFLPTVHHDVAGIILMIIWMLAAVILISFLSGLRRRLDRFLPPVLFPTIAAVLSLGGMVLMLLEVR